MTHCFFGTAIIAICIVTDSNPSAKVTAQETVSFPVQYALLSRAHRSDVLSPFLTLTSIFLLTCSNLLQLPPHPFGLPMLLGKSVKRTPGLLNKLLPPLPINSLSSYTSSFSLCCCCHVLHLSLSTGEKSKLGDILSEQAAKPYWDMGLMY